MRTYIETPPHNCTMQAEGSCKACEKWLEYQKAWYFDLEHNFEHPPIAELGYLNNNKN